MNLSDSEISYIIDLIKKDKDRLENKNPYDEVDGARQDKLRNCLLTNLEITFVNNLLLKLANCLKGSD